MDVRTRRERNSFLLVMWINRQKLRTQTQRCLLADFRFRQILLLLSSPSLVTGLATWWCLISYNYSKGETCQVETIILGCGLPAVHHECMLMHQPCNHVAWWHTSISSWKLRRTENNRSSKIECRKVKDCTFFCDCIRARGWSQIKPSRRISRRIPSS